MNEPGSGNLEEVFLLKTLIQRLQKLPDWAKALVCAGIAFLIGVVDDWTGVEIGFSIFYLAPVLLATWLLGLRWGMGLSLFSATLWLIAERVGGRVYSHPFIGYWNAGIRLSFFLTGSYLLWRLKGALRFEAEARRIAEDATRLKSQMVSLVSHEFGNGLSSAIMAAYMLQESEPKAEAESEQRRQYYEVLRRSHENLKAVSANYLNLGRMEAGRFTLSLQRTEFRSLIRNSLPLFELGLKFKRLRLHMELPEEVIPVRVDSEAMTLVVNNLIGNAVKYTPAEGEITLRLSRLPGDSGQVEFSIQDNGIGLSPEDAEKVFSGFFRAEGGKSMAKGYGVGLKVCQEIISHHGSRLRVESSPGKGARFFFHLPVWTEPAVPAAAAGS